VLPNAIVETRQYDALNRLTEVRTVRVDIISGQEEVVSKLNYTLDEEGNRLSIVEQDGKRVQYKYDELDRLIEEFYSDRTITYTYDTVGNRASKTDSGSGTTTYTYNSLNQLASSVTGEITTTYTYDNSGNLISEVTGSNSKTYRWLNDGENRLMEVTVIDTTGTHNIEYKYDYQGIRVAQVIDGVETRFLVDGLQTHPQVLAEYDVVGNIKTSYTYGKELISQQQEGVQHYYLTDGLGSTKTLANESGQVTDRYLYDAFGNTLLHSGNSANTYQFAGEQRSIETGLDYLRARYYNPSTGRFISADAYEGSLTDPMSLHDYIYAHANPVMNTDPSGYMTLGEALAGIAIVGFFAGLGYTTGAGIAAGGSLYDMLTRYDQYLAGFADIATFSGSTRLREKLHGDTATADHRGLFFNLGRFAGGLAGFGLGAGAPNVLSSVAWAERIAQIHTAVGAAVGSFNSTRNIMEGRATPWDILPFLPLAGYTVASSTRGLDWLAVKGATSSDFAINNSVTQTVSESGSITGEAFASLLQAEGRIGRVSKWWLDLRGYIIRYRGQAEQTAQILSPIAREVDLEASYALVERMRATGLSDAEIANMTAKFHNTIPPASFVPEELASLRGEPVGAAGIPTSSSPGIASSYAGPNGVTYILKLPKETTYRTPGYGGLKSEYEYVILHQIPNQNIVRVVPARNISALTVDEAGNIVFPPGN
jgi:RHS repeat-associated protein